MYGKKLSKALLGQLTRDWRHIRIKLELNIPFNAQLKHAELHLRQARKDNQTREVVKCARGFRFEGDPPHDEENPSFAMLFEMASTDAQQEAVKETLLQAWFGEESVNKLDEDATDTAGGPVGEVALEFLTQYRKHCDLILQGKAQKLEGMRQEANDALIYVARIAASVIENEPNFMGTLYEETLSAFDKKREERLDENLETYLDLMNDSKAWKPRIASFLLDGDNDDATGPRLQHMIGRCVAEKASITLVADACSELRWLVNQKHRPGGYNRFILKLVQVCVKVWEKEGDSEEATTVIDTLNLCKRHLSMHEEMPQAGEDLRKKLEQQSSSEKHHVLVTEIESIARKFEGKDEEMEQLSTKLALVANDNTLIDAIVQELKDVRGTLLTKLNRLVRNSEKRDEAFQKSSQLVSTCLGAITAQVKIQKEDETTTEKQCCAVLCQMADVVIDMKSQLKDLQSDLEDNPDQVKADFRNKLQKAHDMAVEFEAVKKTAEASQVEGSSYISTLSTEGNSTHSLLCSMVSCESTRLDKIFEASIVKETKRVIRVHAGGDKKDWKAELSGNEKMSDLAFVAKCKDLEKTFHEADFLERLKSLQEETGTTVAQWWFVVLCVQLLVHLCVQHEFCVRVMVVSIALCKLVRCVYLCMRVCVVCACAGDLSSTARP